MEPGDEVLQGQLLLRMDTQELEIERAQLLAELEVALLETTNAAKEKDIAVAAQSQARADIARNKLAAVEHKIAQADIVSPCPGAVLLGDITPRVGEVVPLGEPLLEFAPHSHWIVELHVPEYAAPYLGPGQVGEFTTNARPDERSHCQLSRIDPASAVVNGQNVFTAEAQVDGETPSWLRSGMQGVARINAGKQPVWWVWLHRVIDSIRLTYWKL